MLVEKGSGRKLERVMLTLLLISMFTSAFNAQPVTATSTDYRVVKTRVLEPGDNLIHGFVYYKGYLWASTRTSPGRILRIDPETLDYERIILEPGLNDGEDLIEADGYIWVILNTHPSKIIRVYPETMAWEVAVSFQSNELSSGSSLEYAFGYLWAGGRDRKIAKIDSSDLTYEIYFYSTVASDSQFQALTSGGGYIWGSLPHYSLWKGWYADTILRINPSNPMDYNSVYINMPMSDEMAYIGGYLYTGSEKSPSYIYKISDDLTYSSAKASDTVCYAIAANHGSIWGAYAGTPGKIVEFDLNLNIKATYQLPVGFNNANEIAFDAAGNMYVTCWESPARIVKLSPKTRTIITIAPSNFTLKTGESITITATLTDLSGNPLPGKPIWWAITGVAGPLRAELNTLYGTTNSSGQVTVTCTAQTTSSEASVKVFAEFRGDDLHSKSIGITFGTVLPFSPPLMLVLVLGMLGMLLAFTKIGEYLPYSRRVLSRTNFRRTLMMIFLFGLSFLLWLWFSYGEAPTIWFWFGLLYIVGASLVLSVLEQSSRWGFIFAASCWSGYFGVLLPHPEVTISGALLVALFLSIIFGGVCAGFARLGRWIAGTRKPPIQIPAPPRARAKPTLPTLPPTIKRPTTFRVPTIRWPVGIDYQESFQNPRHFVLDQDLKSGIIKRDPLGMPKVISGRYGCVFRIQCGNEVYATKCYTLQMVDLQERYELISHYLDKVNLPFFIKFIYVPKGVLVRGEPYPILKMEWADGERLDKFIADNLHDSDLLKRVAEKFIDTVIELQRNRIAHGDLHHENILVDHKDNSIKLHLVDYDGIYIPDFLGKEAPELGHADYQHPRRSEKHYDERLDNFSSLVIYLSLLAVAEDPRLWKSYYDGECMILTNRDFKEPQKSNAIQELLKSRSERVKKLTKLLLKALEDDPLNDKIQPAHFKTI